MYQSYCAYTTEYRFVNVSDNKPILPKDWLSLESSDKLNYRRETVTHEVQEGTIMVGLDKQDLEIINALTNNVAFFSQKVDSSYDVVWLNRKIAGALSSLKGSNPFYYYVKNPWGCGAVT